MVVEGENDTDFRGSPDDAIDAEAVGGISEDDDGVGDPDQVEPLGDIDPAADDIDLASATADVDPRSRASKRIEGLVAKNKEYEASIGKLREEFGQTLYQERQQSANEMQQTHQALQELQRYTKNLESKLNSISEDKEDLSEAQKFQRKLQRDMTPRVQGMLKDEVSPIAQRLERLEAHLQERDKRAAMNRTLDEFEQRSIDTSSAVLEERVGRQQSGKLVETFAPWFLNGAAAARKPPEEFAPDFKQALDAYYSARKAHEQTSRQEARKQGKQVPARQRRSASGARGTAMPNFTRDEIHRGGYKDYMEASRDNTANCVSNRPATKR